MLAFALNSQQKRILHIALSRLVSDGGDERYAAALQKELGGADFSSVAMELQRFVNPHASHEIKVTVRSEDTVDGKIEA